MRQRIRKGDVVTGPGELEEEMAAVRGAMRAAGLMMAGGELDALALYRVSKVIIQGAGMVATLLKMRRFLAGDGEAEMWGVLGVAVEELFDENGWVRE
jgi:hypothetical protein